MKTNLVSISKLIPVESIVPNGFYYGTWSDFTVKFFHKGEQYEAKTECYINSINVPCTVTINDDELTVHSIK